MRFQSFESLLLLNLLLVYIYKIFFNNVCVCLFVCLCVYVCMCV